MHKLLCSSGLALDMSGVTYPVPFSLCFAFSVISPPNCDSTDLGGEPLTGASTGGGPEQCLVIINQLNK